MARAALLVGCGLLGAVGASSSAGASCEDGSACDTTGWLQLHPAEVSTPQLLTSSDTCPGSAVRGEGDDDDDNALDIVWASDLVQAEGLMASLASALAAAKTSVRAHILVQRSVVPRFQKIFGMRRECLSAAAKGGRAVVMLHPVDPGLVEKSVPVIPGKYLKTHGRLDSPEVYARLYMHKLFKAEVVIWLDCDTIVRSDLTPLRTQLLDSHRTIGFVDRPADRVQRLSTWMDPENPCHFMPKIWTKLQGMTAYNIGVYAVNLKRWAKLDISERIEGLVSQHNECGGKLWVGDDQAALSLAFSVPAALGQGEDYLVYAPTWNHLRLGYKHGLNQAEFESAHVLHWNGRHKPWVKKGLYKSWWTDHRKSFSKYFAESV